MFNHITLKIHVFTSKLQNFIGVTKKGAAICISPLFFKAARPCLCNIILHMVHIHQQYGMQRNIYLSGTYKSILGSIFFGAQFKIHESKKGLKKNT